MQRFQPGLRNPGGQDVAAVGQSIQHDHGEQQGESGREKGQGAPAAGDFRAEAPQQREGQQTVQADYAIVDPIGQACFAQVKKGVNKAVQLFMEEKIFVQDQVGKAAADQGPDEGRFARACGRQQLSAPQQEQPPGYYGNGQQLQGRNLGDQFALVEMVEQIMAAIAQQQGQSLDDQDCENQPEEERTLRAAWRWRWIFRHEEPPSWC
jgi:hypothetical protein